ncbi:hypothetical protein ECTW09098_3015, partial [Escherichia coli TW09098]
MPNCKIKKKKPFNIKYGASLLACMLTFVNFINRFIIRLIV